MRAFSETLRDAALALLYPRDCEVCGSVVESHSDGAACSKCWLSTRIFYAADALCRKCGALQAAAVMEEKLDEPLCRRCAQESFTAARAVGAYEGALRASVIALKREPFVPARLAGLLQRSALQPPLSLATLIIPVPLHPERLRSRGFNQAAELARALSRLTRLPVDELSLARTYHTERHRALMDERARRESVAGAFQVLRPRLVEGEHILLIDDVYTTGATASACAAALTGAGASSVYVLTVARPL
ncbi:MAG TPA: double zinc ribbon domain-containing protein [Pyrinomonadaceae bacterium]|nr:double zinc ribbon domain-containing protein [Pyrinomonadaceae bacterium]